MSIQLPAPIEHYIQIENSGALEAVPECFATDAIVRDEGQTFEGVAAIKNWMAATRKKYGHTVAPLEFAERGGQCVLKARLAGSFPGSPITVSFSFVLAGGKKAAPQPIENELKKSSYIELPIVLGDRHKFLAVLIVPKFDRVREYAAQMHAAFQPESIDSSPEIRALFQKEIDAYLTEGHRAAESQHRQSRQTNAELIAKLQRARNASQIPG